MKIGTIQDQAKNRRLNVEVVEEDQEIFVLCDGQDAGLGGFDSVEAAVDAAIIAWQFFDFQAIER